MEKVTVIVPAYNAEKDIHRCLDSISRQTYPDLEVLIINDGSTDQTERICQEYCCHCDRLRMINGEHQGVSAARNLGIRHAQGKYLFFMDADDELPPRSIEVLMDHHTKGEWIIGNYKMNIIPGTGQPELHLQYFEEEVHCGERSELPMLCVSRNFNRIWGKLYRKDIIAVNNIQFDESSDYGEDLLFNADYFPYVNTFVILKEAVYIYCCRFGEGLGTRYIKDEWDIQIRFCSYLEDLCRNRLGLGQAQCDQMNRFYFDQACAALGRIAEEKSLIRKEKKHEIRKITSSGFFINILKKEVRLKKLNFLDFFLLKRNLGLTYHVLHKTYATMKKYLYRSKR